MRTWAVAGMALLLSMALATPALAGPEVAVTVDDLPTHGAMPPGTTRRAIADQMIHALRRHAVPGVYGFMNGGQLQHEPELEAIVRAWRQAGFVLGNHTYSHLDLTRVAAVDYVADIERNEAVLKRFSRTETSRYFRYPYLHEGNTEDKRTTVREWLAARAYTIAPVTVSLEDEGWAAAYARCVGMGDTLTIARLKRRFVDTSIRRMAAFDELSQRLFKRSIKHILLVHMGAFDAMVLDDLLAAHRAAGARFIRLSEAVQDPAYRIAAQAAVDDGATFLVHIARDKGVPLPAVLTDSSDELARLCR